MVEILGVIIALIVVGGIFYLMVFYVPPCDRCNKGKGTAIQSKKTGKIYKSVSELRKNEKDFIPIPLCQECVPIAEEEAKVVEEAARAEEELKNIPIPCPSCKQQISPKSPNCMHCGHPISDTPLCPTCRSANVHRISKTAKLGYVAAVGVLAPAFKSVRSTFACNNCGYKW